MEEVPNAGLGFPLSPSQQLKSEDEQAVDDNDITRKSEGGVVGYDDGVTRKSDGDAVGYDDEDRPVRLLRASAGS